MRKKLKNFTYDYGKPVGGYHLIDNKVQFVDWKEDKSNKGLSWQDFSIKSLQEAGAVDLLKHEVQLHGNTLEIADSIGDSVTNAENYDNKIKEVKEVK